jgi:hypothetical protein
LILIELSLLRNITIFPSSISQKTQVQKENIMNAAHSEILNYKLSEDDWFVFPQIREEWQVALAPKWAFALAPKWALGNSERISICLEL